MRKFREKAASEQGFTLVELLVVMLILALLAAIAIPSFFNQRDKAQDSEAKATAKSASTAMETYSTDNGGKYTGATAANLKVIEETLDPAKFSVTVDASGDGYTVTGTSDTKNSFSIKRAVDGTVTYPCTVDAGNGTNRGGCPSSAFWD